MCVLCSCTRVCIIMRVPAFVRALAQCLRVRCAKREMCQASQWWRVCHHLLFVGAVQYGACRGHNNTSLTILMLGMSDIGLGALFGFGSSASAGSLLHRCTAVIEAA